MNGQNGYQRQAIALLGGVLLFVLVVYTLEKTGVPRSYGIGLAGMFALAVFVVATFPAGTTRSERFLTANREVRPGISALASAGILGFPLLYLQGGAVFLMQPGFLVVMGIGLTGGLALAGLLAARQFNATQAADIAEMLHRRFGSALAPRIFAAANAIGGLILAACGILSAATLISWFFALSSLSATLLTLAGCFLIAAIGGAASVTRFAAVATLLLLIGLNLPLLIHTLNEHGFPVGHFTAGISALQPAWELEQQLTSLQLPLLSDQVTVPSNIINWSSGVQILAGLVLLVATASLPALVQNTSTSHDDEIAGSAIRRALLYAGFLTASLFALMAFTKIGFYQSMLGLTLSEARVEAPVLYSWSGRDFDLIRFCGERLENAEAVLLACSGVDNHIVNVPDFAFNSTLMLAAAPDIATLPLGFTALLTIALLAILLAFTSATILATSSNLVTAFYVTRPGKVASGRVFMIRLTLLAVLACAVLLAGQVIDDMGAAFVFALALSAVTTVPGLIGGFYLRRCTSTAVSTAIGTGFALTVLYFVLVRYGIDFKPDTGDEVIVRLPGMISAVPGELGVIFALPIALFIMVLITILSASAPSTAGHDATNA